MFERKSHRLRTYACVPAQLPQNPTRKNSFLFSVQCDPFIYPSSWAHRWSYSWWGIEEEWLRVRWVVLGLTVLHRAVPETNCAILCSSSSGLPSPLPYSKYSSTPEEAVAVCVSVYVCICVCGTNVGQAVINLGLAMRSQTVNSRFSFRFLYTVEDKACPFFFWVWSRKQASAPCMFDVWLHSNKKKKVFVILLWNVLSFSVL